MVGLEYISKSKFEVSWSSSASLSSGFGLSWQTKVVTEMCSESDYGVVDGVGGHTECLRDGICPELPDGGMLSESEKVVEKGVPLQILPSCMGGGCLVRPDQPGCKFKCPSCWSLLVAG